MTLLNDVWKVERKFGYYIILLNILISVIYIIGLLLFMLYDKYKSLKNRNFIEINARIKNIDNISTSKIFGIKIYNCKANIVYMVGNKKYNKTTTFNLLFRPKVNDVGQILYDPRDPNKFIVPHQFTTMLKQIVTKIFVFETLKYAVLFGLINTLCYVYRHNKYLQTLFGLQIFGFLHTVLHYIMPSYPF
tara:strand:- start:250 stop:819 length:570 start_codon:yes stop_codon:yes gene_type:complete